MAEVANKRIFFPSSVMYCGFQILLNHLVIKFSIMDPAILSDFNKKKSQYMCNCVPKIAKYAHFCRRKHNKRVSKFCTIFRPFCTFLRKFVHSFFISNMNRSPARFLKTIGTFWGMSVPTLKLFLILFRGYKSQKQPVGFFLVPENACIIKLPAQ